eukprot:6490646-Amphidinium_carterae.1
MEIHIVLPEVKTAPVRSGGDQSASETTERRLHDMLEGLAEAPREEKVRLASNYCVLKALDHCLQVSLKKGLACYIPRKLLRPLGRNERRYNLQKEQCIEKCQNGQDLRVCVWDADAGRSRYEISPIAPHCLHIICDQGPMGWPSLHFMTASLNVCSTYRWDESHRVWNDTKLCVSRCGLDMIRIAATAIYNTASGPYGSGAWQNDISWAAEQFVTQGGPDDALFLLHFDEIAKETHTYATWGTPEHQEEVWSKFCEQKPLWSQGAHVKYSRWFSFLQRSEEMLGSWHSLLLVLTWLGVEKKWWKRREQFPLWNPTDVLDVYKTLGNIEEDEGEETVAGAQGLNELRKKTANQLHMTALLLANPMLRSLVAIMCEIAKPVSVGHANMVGQLKSPAGSLAYWISCATGAWEQDLRDILDTLRSEDKLRAIGFKMGPDAQTDEDVDEEELMRDKSVEFAFHLVGQRCLTRLTCSCSLPLRFAALLSDEAGIRTECLRELKLWWEVLKYWEVVMVDNLELRDLHASLLWPRQQWVRWVFGALEEVDFGCVPERVARALLPCFEGVTNTEPVEDMFHYLRAEQRRSPNHQLSRAMRWWHALQSPVLMEDRQQSRVDHDSVNATAPYLPKQLFSSAAGEPSVGWDSLAKICGPQSWPSPGIEAFSQLPLLWLSAVQRHPNLDMLCGAWRSCLLVPHTIVTGPAGRGGFVLMTSAHGALLWRLFLRGTDKVTMLDWNVSGTPWSFVRVDDITEWQVMDFQ